MLRCGYKSMVKLLLRPGTRGVGIEISAHSTVVDVVDAIEDVVEGVVVDVVQVDEITSALVTTADAGATRYGPKNSSAMTVSNATKRVFFINMTIAKSWKETYVATDLDLNNSYFTQPPTHKELFDGCEAQCKVSQDVIN